MPFGKQGILFHASSTSGITAESDPKFAQFNVRSLPGDGQEWLMAYQPVPASADFGRRAMSCQRMPLRCWKPMQVLLHEMPPFIWATPADSQWLWVLTNYMTFSLNFCGKGKMWERPCFSRYSSRGSKFKLFPGTARNFSDPTQHWFFSVQQNLVPTAAGWPNCGIN